MAVKVSMLAASWLVALALTACQGVSSNESSASAADAQNSGNGATDGDRKEDDLVVNADAFHERYTAFDSSTVTDSANGSENSSGSLAPVTDTKEFYNGATDGNRKEDDLVVNADAFHERYAASDSSTVTDSANGGENSNGSLAPVMDTKEFYNGATDPGQEVNAVALTDRSLHSPYTTPDSSNGSENSDQSSVSAMGAQGLYNGKTSLGQEICAVVLDDGSFYAFYVNPESGNDKGGMLQGTAKALGGSLSSSEIINYNMNNLINNKIVISASYAPKSFLKGALIGLDKDKKNIAFTAEYDASYEDIPTLAAIASNYKGLVNGLNASKHAGIVIKNTGDINFYSEACMAGGTIAPHASGNVYSLTLKFKSSQTCAYANQTLSGIATLSDNVVVMFARAADTSYPWLFIGQSQNRHEPLAESHDSIQEDVVVTPPKRKKKKNRKR